MLCPASTGKSGSSWLNRLRTSKGFADDDPTDLENFLRIPKSSNPEMLDPKPIHDPTTNEDNQLLNIMSNVLNELFIFGDNSSNSTNFKSARKQKNPRICAIPSTGSSENENADTDKVRLLRSCDSERVKELDNCEDEGRDGNLVGFSRTEITVIDTSYDSWKFEKLLYRRKNVWKVREKKVKDESCGSKKKRKVSGGVVVDHRVGKKSKADKFPLNEINVSKILEKTPNDRTLKKKQLDLNSKNGSSSIFFLKSIHTGKKNGSSTSRSCLKLKQKNTEGC